MSILWISVLLNSYSLQTYCRPQLSNLPASDNAVLDVTTTTAAQQSSSFEDGSMSVTSTNRTSVKEGRAESLPCRSDYWAQAAADALCQGTVWSCAGKCGQFRPLPCSCHPNCVVYRTCCHDYRAVCPRDKCQITNFQNIAMESSQPTFGNFLENFPGILVPFQLTKTSGNSSTVGKPASITQTTPYSTGSDNATNVTTEEMVDGSFNARKRKGLGSETTPRNDFKEEAPEEQTPRAHCVKDVRARLIDYCPADTRPASEYLRPCTTQDPRQLTDITPVTDISTGLHFRNIHCHACWYNYLLHVAEQTEECNGWNATQSGLTPVLPWKAQILMSYDSRPSNDTSLQALFEFIVNSSAAVNWRSPEGYPFHSCNPVFDAQQCPSCAATNAAFDDIAELCRSFYSYVTIMGRVFANKYCALCQLSDELIQQQGLDTTKRNAQEDILKEIANLRCVVPRSSMVEATFHDFSFSVTMSFKSTESRWVFENDGLENANGARMMPKGGQASWKVMECSEEACQEVTCAHYSWRQSGQCLDHVMPVTTTLRICLLTTAHSSSCSSRFSQFVDKTSTLFLRDLQTQALQVLLSMFSPYRNLSKNDIRTELDLQQGYIFLHYYSPHDITRTGFDPPNVELSSKFIDALGESLVSRMQALTFKGRMEVCAGVNAFRMTSVDTADRVTTCSTHVTEERAWQSTSSADLHEPLWPICFVVLPAVMSLCMPL